MIKHNLKFLKFLIPLSALLLWSCGKNPGLRRNAHSSRPAVTPSSVIDDSFLVETLAPKGDSDISISKENRFRISINKNALEKEFLLQAQLIQSGPVPMFNGLKSRVIAFRKRGDRIYLLEATQGHAVDLEIPQNLLLTDFSILEEKGDWISFDFNEGLSRIFVASDWRNQDYEGSEHKPDFKFLKANMSYLDSALLDDKNQLYINQVAQVSKTEGADTSANAVEVRYYLSAYRPNLEFEPFKSKDYDRMGFFEVAPKLNDEGGHVIHAAKFDVSKPIVFAISANTPEEYKEAIRDGILYWNKALGHDVIKVIFAPKGINAPHMDYNIVQWANWDNAGWAYADSQMDPRNGEILHAQVFLPSAFTFFSKFRARQIYHFLKKGEKVGGKNSLRISLKGLFSSPMCQLNRADTGMDETLLSMLESGADDSKFLKASQDYLREVTAHEIGHTLGLRHNFAGSLSANYALADRPKLFSQYFHEGKAPRGVVTSSSLMEYEDFAESMLSGDQVKRNLHALLYDEKSIQTLYYGAKYDQEEIPLFCTDSHNEKDRFMDCLTGDVGSSPVDFVRWKTRNLVENLPKKILEEYIWARSGAFGIDPTPMEKIGLSPKEVAFSILESRYAFIKGLTSEGSFLKIRRQFPFVGPLNKEEVREAEMEYLLAETEKVGGLKEVLRPIPSTFFAEEFQRFVGMLDSGKYDQGIGPGSKPYTFSESDKQVMKNMARLFYKKLQTELVRKDLEILAGNLHPNEAALVTAGTRPSQDDAKLEDHPFLNKFSELLADRINEYTFSTTGEFIEDEVTVKDGENIKTIKVKLPRFSYPFELRTLAAGLLKKDRSKVINWGFRSRAQFSSRLKGIISKSFADESMDNITFSEQSEKVTHWILENQAITKAWAWE